MNIKEVSDIVHVQDQTKICFNIGRPRTNYGKVSVRFTAANNWNKMPLLIKMPALSKALTTRRSFGSSHAFKI